MSITINVPNETIAFWLSDLFEKEAREAEIAADNERLFALGSDDEETARQHESNSAEAQAYASLLRKAKEELQEYA